MEDKELRGEAARKESSAGIRVVSVLWAIFVIVMGSFLIDVVNSWLGLRF